MYVYIYICIYICIYLDARSLRTPQIRDVYGVRWFDASTVLFPHRVKINKNTCFIAPWFPVSSSSSSSSLSRKVVINVCGGWKRQLIKEVDVDV